MEKTLTDSDLEHRLNRGLKVEQRGLEGGRMAHRPWGYSVLRPHPLPSLYRWPGGPLAAIRGGGVPLGLPLPKGVLPTGESESKEDSSHMWRPHHPNFSQPHWGALPLQG